MMNIAFDRGWRQAIDALPYKNPYYVEIHPELYHEFLRGMGEAYEYIALTRPIIYKILEE